MVEVPLSEEKRLDLKPNALFCFGLVEEKAQKPPLTPNPNRRSVLAKPTK